MIFLPKLKRMMGMKDFRVVGERTFQFGRDLQRDLVMVAEVNKSLIV
ncbi:MAG: hypothetical protein AAGA83_23490 [Cyanobacteria bacterium P01_F01_bin.116]